MVLSAGRSTRLALRRNALVGMKLRGNYREYR